MGRSKVKCVLFKGILTSKVVQQEAVMRFLVKKGIFTREEFLKMAKALNEKMINLNSSRIKNISTSFFR